MNILEKRKVRSDLCDVVKNLEIFFELLFKSSTIRVFVFWFRPDKKYIFTKIDFLFLHFLKHERVGWQSCLVIRRSEFSGCLILTIHANTKHLHTMTGKARFIRNSFSPSLSPLFSSSYRFAFRFGTERTLRVSVSFFHT